jgi:phytanoyl-CoA hydroxylase
VRCTAAQLTQFERDGFVVVDEVLSPGEVRDAILAMERIYRGEYSGDRRPPPLRKPVPRFGSESSVHWILNARVLDDMVWRLSTSRELGEMAASLLRARSVSIVEDQLLNKPPNGLPVNMHQDRAYWPFSRSDQMVSCWIALVDITPELGPPEFVPGSQRWQLAGRPKELIRGNDADWMEAVERVRPEGHPIDVVPAVLPAGGAVFFHSLTFHGSRQNVTSNARKAMSLHWAGDECRINLGATAVHDFPYFFARLSDGGPIVNNYMPVVYP